MGVGGQRRARPVHPQERDPVPIVQEAGWASGPVWMGVENLAPTGIRSPDPPALYIYIYNQFLGEFFLCEFMYANSGLKRVTYVVQPKSSRNLNAAV